MIWRYRIKLRGGQEVIVEKTMRMYTPMEAFRPEYPALIAVEESKDGGEWIDSALLPTDPWEAEAIEAGPGHD